MGPITTECKTSPATEKQRQLVEQLARIIWKVAEHPGNVWLPIDWGKLLKRQIWMDEAVHWYGKAAEQRTAFLSIVWGKGLL